MSSFKNRHPLLMRALPNPQDSPLDRTARGQNHLWKADSIKLNAGHDDYAQLMHSARSMGGKLIRDQLHYLWPQASEHDLALAKGLGVALWLTEMLLFVREDATGTPPHINPPTEAGGAYSTTPATRGVILLPRDLMRQYLVEPSQLLQGQHDFALRRLSEHVAKQSMKILQGSAPLGLSAPLRLRYRLRWTMLYTGFILQEMQRDPHAPFIRPSLSFKDRLLLLKNTLFISSSSPRNGGSCGSGGCSN
ncbi:MAG TPA: hypothetical protein ENO09_04235 [bacterium]|nr:hypothetical protein [bacterium]